MRRLLILLALVLALPPLPRRASPSGLPEDGPPALYRAEPALPRAPGWPGSEALSRTSGTGRWDQGSFLWTDWLYDDHGAMTAPLANPAQTAGSPSFGGYRYDSPTAHANGADLFRAGIFRKGADTYFRVDWTTLADPAVPMAVGASTPTTTPRPGLQLVEAGIAAGCSELTVATDGPTVVSLEGASGATTRASFSSGTRTVTVLSSKTAAPRVTRCTPPRATGRPAGGPGGVAATGASTPLATLGLLLLALVLVRRRA